MAVELKCNRPFGRSQFSYEKLDKPLVSSSRAWPFYSFGQRVQEQVVDRGVIEPKPCRMSRSTGVWVNLDIRLSLVPEFLHVYKRFSRTFEQCAAFSFRMSDEPEAWQKLDLATGLTTSSECLFSYPRVFAFRIHRKILIHQTSQKKKKTSKI